MPKKEDVGKVGPLHVSGYFDWPDLYKQITGWGKNELCQVWEIFYKDKVGGLGKDIEVQWYFVRKVDKMHKYEMKVLMKIWDCRIVEVTKNGQTQKKWAGRAQVYMESSIDRDFQGFFDGPFTKHLWGIYDSLTHLQKFSFNHWDHWYYKMYELQGIIKNNFGADTR